MAKCKLPCKITDADGVEHEIPEFEPNVEIADIEQYEEKEKGLLATKGGAMGPLLRLRLEFFQKVLDTVKEAPDKVRPPHKLRMRTGDVQACFFAVWRAALGASDSPLG